MLFDYTVKNFIKYAISPIRIIRQLVKWDEYCRFKIIEKLKNLIKTIAKKIKLLMMTCFY